MTPGGLVGRELRGTYVDRNGRYAARLMVNGRRIHLGVWPTKKAAALAYDRAVLYFGGEQTLNYPAMAKRRGAASPAELTSEARRKSNRSLGMTSRYIGVTWDSPSEKWHARVMIDGAYQRIGSFSKEKDAALARDRVALREQGPNTALNFPGSVPKSTLHESVARAERRHRARSAVTCRGVRARPGTRSWDAHLAIGKGLFLGTWPTWQEAAVAHDRALLYYGGSKAFLNFPDRAAELKPASAKALVAETAKARRSKKRS